MTTDPRDMLSGPPRYLPTELADLGRSLLGDVPDGDLRRALRKWGEACFEAGFGAGIDDPTPDTDRRTPSTGYSTSYGTATVEPAPSGTPTFDQLSSSRTERTGLP